MEVLWTAYTDTKKEKNAHVILRNIAKKIGSIVRIKKFEKHHSDQTIEIYFYTDYSEMTMEQIVFKVLVDAQSFGRAWQLYGDITSQSSGISRDFNIPGLIQVEFHIEAQ